MEEGEGGKGGRKREVGRGFWERGDGWPPAPKRREGPDKHNKNKEAGRAGKNMERLRARTIPPTHTPPRSPRALAAAVIEVPACVSRMPSIFPLWMRAAKWPALSGAE